MTLERYEIDGSHSVVSFLVRHLVISKVRGAFTHFSGSLLLDLDDLGRSQVEAVVETASIDTNEPDRDRHLRSADFLDVERYPEMRFVSTGVEVLDQQHVRVSGDLTLHGETHPVVLDATFGGHIRDPWGAERVGFEASMTFDRRAYGLVWNAALEAGGVLVGDVVEVDLELEAVKADSAEG